MEPETRNALGDWAVRLLAFGSFVWVCFIVWAVFWMGSLMLQKLAHAEHSEDETLWHASPDVRYEISDDEVVILSGRVVMITETEVVIVSIDDNGLFDVLNRYRWREDGDG